jgi:hypothetical protein
VGHERLRRALWHLRRVPETQPSMFDTYLASFDEVWATATIVQER